MEGEGKFEYFGSHYVGNFHKNQKTGEGTMHYSTGETFKGFWLYDRPSSFLLFIISFIHFQLNKNK